jgi:hypothetical protein
MYRSRHKESGSEVHEGKKKKIIRTFTHSTRNHYYEEGKKKERNELCMRREKVRGELSIPLGTKVRLHGLIRYVHCGRNKFGQFSQEIRLLKQ